MREAKKKALEAAGWRVGGAFEFLGLSAQESRYLELKVKLAKCLKERRKQRKLAQSDVAKLVESSQSRVAKMEAGDASVSIDLLIRSLLALGVSNPELGRLIAR
jgi:predicted XRE-type DNA-binding protein